ncbi:MAG TPA: oligopeptide:H+ symporter, partial [Gammaproteobacteria bacterium]
ARRDAGFSIFYMGINLGAFIAPLIVAPFADYFGFRAGFFLSGVAISLGTFQFRFTRKLLGDAGLHPHPSTEGELKRNWKLFWGGLVALAILGGLALGGVFTFDAAELARVLGAVTVGLALYFFGYVMLFGHLDKAQMKRVGVIAVFFVAAAIFFAGFEQASSTFNLFARDYTDRSFLGSWFESGEHPAGLYQSVNPIFIILLAPAFAWFWMFLAKRNLEPSAPAKFALGLIQLGLGFAVMAFAANLAVQADEVLPTWLLLTYLLHTTAELCLSPIGLSNVTKLAPKQYVSQMMGTWFMGVSLGNLIAGVLGGHVGGADITEMPSAFWTMTWIGVVSGVLLLAATPLLKKMMGGVR